MHLVLLIEIGFSGFIWGNVEGQSIVIMPGMNIIKTIFHTLYFISLTI